MGTDTSIQWTGSTWNPVRGCSRVSPGCESCYAEGVAARFSGTVMKDGKEVRLPYYGLARRSKSGEPRWTGEVRMVPEHLADPLRWTRPRKIFVNSMSDLFHEKLTNEQIAAVFGVMAAAPRHTFQVLTKRATRMREWFEWVQKKTSGYWHGEHGMLWVALQSVAPEIATEQSWKAMYEAAHGTEPATKLGDVGAAFRWPLPNVWLGVSAEDQKRADERVPQLLATPAAVRFVSYEPALELVDFSRWIERVDHCRYGHENPPQIADACPECGGTLISTWGHDQAERYRTGERYEKDGPLERDEGPQLHWVIVGGESGRAARTFDLDWARNVRDQCARAGVACFIKQLGARPYGGDPAFGGTGPLTLKDGHGGDWDEWEEGLRVREFPGENRP